VIVMLFREATLQGAQVLWAGVCDVHGGLTFVTHMWFTFAFTSSLCRTCGGYSL